MPEHDFPIHIHFMKNSVKKHYNNTVNTVGDVWENPETGLISKNHWEGKTLILCSYWDKKYKGTLKTLQTTMNIFIVDVTNPPKGK